MRLFLFFLFCVAAASAEDISLPGLQQPVEILRDQWGVPHIYAKSSGDLFLAEGYIAARDRLFQIDLWRRINTGKLAEVMGPEALSRDRIARLVRYRGDWEKEWTSYSPDARQIVSAFVAGVNAYIGSLKGKWPLEFRLAGYSPGLWSPEDCAGRIAGLLMTRNLSREVERAIEIREFGAELVERIRPPDPFVKLTVPAGLDLKSIQREILFDYARAVSTPQLESIEGSNNWVVDGSRTTTGKPLLANDPHRPLMIPSLRKTVHLVAPGWNVFGAGEPALPGIALGHNEEIAFGFTIVGIDQGDLYVEKLNPKNPDEYWNKGTWHKVEIERQKIPVKGQSEQTVELKYTVHGPVIFEDRGHSRAFALKWVGAEPGGAGYLAALGLVRAKNWREFLAGVANYKVPSENLVYADRAGNIGWIAAGLAPVRKNWNGLLPVPGTGEFEWSGYLKVEDHPQEYNPPRHWIATANHNILPPGYSQHLGFEWAAPFRYQRVAEMLAGEQKFGVADFERMQYDVTSLVAKRFQRILARHVGAATGALKTDMERLIKWDARMTPESTEATLFEVWIDRVGEFLVASPLALRMEARRTLELLDKETSIGPLRMGYEAAVRELTARLGADRGTWRWGRIHTLTFTHPLRVSQRLASQFHRGPIERPGDANTVNAAGGAGLRQTSGPSYRQIIDVANWDRSMMTNVPGESGDPESPHYGDLLNDWATGRYHPMPFSRKAVEAATVERITLRPAR